ncbi:MAG: ABC transporter permease [Gemmatimonadota bacterium]|jgi:predicted permease
MGNGDGDDLARWLLERCAPGDARVALADLREERERSRRRGRRAGAVRFWFQLALVCAWGLRDRARPGGRRLLPLHALRMALRGLRRTPGVALTGVLTLGVGLAAAVTLLGVWMGSTRPLPVPQGEEIVRLRVLDARSSPTAPPAGALEAWEGAPGLEGVAAWAPAGGVLVTGEGPALRVNAAAMTPRAFELLEVPAARGRLPSAGAGDRDAIVLGWEVWRDALGGGPGVIGSTVRLDGRPRTVVGVMPEGFGFPLSHDTWTVLDPPAAGLPDGASMLGRLADGVAPEEVAPALEAALASLPLREGATGPYRVRVLSWVGGRGEGGEAWAFGALGVLVGILVVVCAANVSTLLLVRALERIRVLAVHSALGAARAQVVLQLFLEALVVAVAGGGVGLALGYPMLGWIEAKFSPHWGYFWMRMDLRPGVLLGTLVAVVGAAVLAGTMPALLALRTDLRSAMGNGPSSEGGTRRAGRWFVAAQVALSTVALVAAVVMTRGLLSSDRLVEGLPVDRIALGSITPGPRYPDPASRLALARELREAVAALPGVRVASVSGSVPGYGSTTSALTLPGDASAGAAPGDGPDERAASGGAGRPGTQWVAVDPGAFETWGLDLLGGRGLDDRDGPDAAPVVVVNRAFVDRWLGDGPALGSRIRVEGVHEAGWATVVGVVANQTEEGPGIRADRVYVPLAQADPSSLVVSARTSGDPAGVVPALRKAVASVDPELPLDQARTLRDLMAWLLRMPRAMATFGAVGGLAGVLVAAIGLYGVVAFRVRSGLREIGVRMALGAPSARILGQVLREAVAGVLPAVAVGLVVALVVSPVLAMFSFGYPPRGFLPFGVATALMLAVTGLAALRPALRAARLDPSRVLRTE